MSLLSILIDNGISCCYYMLIIFVIAVKIIFFSAQYKDASFEVPIGFSLTLIFLHGFIFKTFRLAYEEIKSEELRIVEHDYEIMEGICEDRATDEHDYDTITSRYRISYDNLHEAEVRCKIGNTERFVNITNEPEHDQSNGYKKLNKLL